MSTLEEDIWDADETDTSVERSVAAAPLKRRAFETTRDKDQSLGLAGADGGAPKYETLKLPFSTSIPVHALRGRESLTFSVRNGAIDLEHAYISNREDFERLAAQPDLVKSVSFDALEVSKLSTPNGLHAEFPTIFASAMHSFGSFAKGGGSGATADGGAKRKESVRFAVKPNKETPGAFERDIEPGVIHHVSTYPTLDPEAVRKTFGRIKDKSWIDPMSPVLDVITPEEKAKYLTEAAPGSQFGELHVWHGDHAELEKKAELVDHLHDTHIAFSDLNLQNFSFNLIVPPQKVYDHKSDMHVQQQPTFYDLASKGAEQKFNSFKAKASKLAQQKGDAAFAQFENERVNFSGSVTVRYWKVVPPCEM